MQLQYLKVLWFSPVLVIVPASLTFTSVSYSTCKFFDFHQCQLQYL
jgi:hypothetical protein